MSESEPSNKIRSPVDCYHYCRLEQRVFTNSLKQKSPAAGSSLPPKVDEYDFAACLRDCEGNRASILLQSFE
jgi:hypothetical protein